HLDRTRLRERQERGQTPNKWPEDAQRPDESRGHGFTLPSRAANVPLDGAGGSSDFGSVPIRLMLAAVTPSSSQRSPASTTTMRSRGPSESCATTRMPAAPPG